MEQSASFVIVKNRSLAKESCSATTKMKSTYQTRSFSLSLFSASKCQVFVVGALILTVIIHLSIFMLSMSDGYIEYIDADRDYFKDDMLRSLTSDTNPWDPPIEMIWYEGSNRNNGIFNPTVIALPSSSKYRYLAAARTAPYALNRSDFSTILYVSNIILCYMELIEGPKRMFQCVDEPKSLNIDIPFDHLKEKLHGVRDEFHWDRFVGPEDPRLVWDPRGSPLLLYGMNSKVKTRHRTMWITDVRTVLKNVTDMWNEECRDKPKVVYKQFELGSNIPDQNKLINALEKNWATMIVPQEEDILFHANLEPRLIFKHNRTIDSDGDLKLELLQGYDSTLLMDCFNRLFDSPQKKDGHVLHQATNMLRIVSCYHNECKPSYKNTYYFQLFHIKNYATYHYDRYIVLWNTTVPEFNFQGIIGPLELPGLEDKKSHFVVSMNFIPTEYQDRRCGRDMDLGFLDSKLVLGIGVEDWNARSFIISAQDLLSGQKACS